MKKQYQKYGLFIEEEVKNIFYRLNEIQISFLVFVMGKNHNGIFDTSRMNQGNIDVFFRENRSSFRDGNPDTSSKVNFDVIENLSAMMNDLLLEGIVFPFLGSDKIYQIKRNIREVISHQINIDNKMPIGEKHKINEKYVNVEDVKSVNFMKDE